MPHFIAFYTTGRRNHNRTTRQCCHSLSPRLRRHRPHLNIRYFVFSLSIFLNKTIFSGFFEYTTTQSTVTMRLALQMGIYLQNRQCAKTENRYCNCNDQLWQRHAMKVQKEWNCKMKMRYKNNENMVLPGRQLCVRAWLNRSEFAPNTSTNRTGYISCMLRFYISSIDRCI